MAMTTQEKWLAEAEKIAAEYGLEYVCNPQYANTGHVRFERQGVFGDPALVVSYSFQSRGYAAFGGDVQRPYVLFHELGEVLAEIRDVLDAAVADGRLIVERKA
jgi:hypothetical protein